MWDILHSIHLNVNKVTITANLLVLCVTSKREYEYCCDRLVYYSSKVAALPTENDIALHNFINCKPVFIWRKQVFWVVTLHGWVLFSKECTASIFRGMRL